MGRRGGTPDDNDFVQVGRDDTDCSDTVKVALGSDADCGDSLKVALGPDADRGDSEPLAMGPDATDSEWRCADAE